ncbi:MAG: hypothetical protein BWX80_03220 [Candidatus Hydrogenedentes bacterium ADurb.Bin101]|nr:MAG: hypothetical protein BWX80_03220 [Candidatus Hydrogenedentes bacterium ADurb.Bin101]
MNSVLCGSGSEITPWTDSPVRVRGSVPRQPTGNSSGGSLNTSNRARCRGNNARDRRLSAGTLSGAQGWAGSGCDTGGTLVRTIRMGWASKEAPFKVYAART